MTAASPREFYTHKLNQACLVNTEGARAKRIDDILHQMRRDKSVPHLVLCAFLQDNARLIKETLK